MFSASATLASGQAVVHLAGEVDIANEQYFTAFILGLLQSPVRRVVLDCTLLTFIDLCGLRCLAGLSRSARQLDRELVLRNPSDIATRVIELLGLDVDLRTDG